MKKGCNMLWWKRVRMVLVMAVVAFSLSLCVEAGEMGGDESASLTLNDAVQRAIDENLTLQMKRTERMQAKGMLKEAASGMLPSLTAGANYTRLDKLQMEMGQHDNYDINVEFNQLVYSGGKVFSARRIAKVYGQAVENGIQQTEQDVIYETQRLFNNVLLSREDLAVAVEAVRLAEENSSEVKKKYDQGIARRFDLLRAEEQLSSAQADEIGASNAVEIAGATLLTYLRLSPDGPLSIEGELDFDPLDVEMSEALTTAYAHRPDLQRREKEVRMQEEAVTVAKAGMKPSVGLWADAGYGNPDHMGEDEWEDEWSAGVAVRVPLFDGLLTRGRVQQERSGVLRQQLALAQLKDHVQLEITKSVLNLQDAEKVVEARKKNVEQAEESLRLVNTGYQEGVNPQIDVLDAQVRYTDSRRAYAKAVYLHTLAKASLWRAMGILKNTQD